MLAVLWKSVIMIAVGTFLLRLAGRKSISQLSVTQTVIMISIGSIIIQPFIEHSLWETIFAATIFILVLILMEFLEIKSKFFEYLFSGKTIAVVENGQVISKNLKKMRLTESQLSMRIRQEGLGDIKDFKIVLLEPNGQIGYELMDEAKTVTVRDLKSILQEFKTELLTEGGNQMKRKAATNEALTNNNTPTESMDKDAYKTQYDGDPGLRGANRKSKHGKQGGE
ncbi:DUF421 domain-containing protein [Bacillus sp. ISL-51]|uniref:DUF421 domain-containing protein n=1 Tax=Bacteria TaxID=2 RepID=UPI001BEC7F7B|nr:MULTISPECIES: YetF domain-containing protein [Bacteria]MBT2573624.1 DUF421 domain-containing protein [Bacillus sp. ISL-51]MBT2633888.1 DUF421 domain-containing protein [Bacillus sp. ISL-26]MBT2712523.1 DUF421 domain-containing protein [Pseudomonas sp. ISL-88]